MRNFILFVLFVVLLSACAPQPVVDSVSAVQPEPTEAPYFVPEKTVKRDTHISEVATGHLTDDEAYKITRPDKSCYLIPDTSTMLALFNDRDNEWGLIKAGGSYQLVSLPYQGCGKIEAHTNKGLDNLEVIYTP